MPGEVTRQEPPRSHAVTNFLNRERTKLLAIAADVDLHDAKEMRDLTLAARAAESRLHLLGSRADITSRVPSAGRASRRQVAAPAPR